MYIGLLNLGLGHFYLVTERSNLIDYCIHVANLMWSPLYSVLRRVYLMNPFRAYQSLLSLHNDNNSFQSLATLGLTRSHPRARECILLPTYHEINKWVLENARNSRSAILPPLYVMKKCFFFWYVKHLITLFLNWKVFVFCISLVVKLRCGFIFKVKFCQGAIHVTEFTQINISTFPRWKEKNLHCYNRMIYE